MDLQITPKKLSGVVTPPSSKSQAHRFLIAAALCGGISIIHGLAESQDIDILISDHDLDREVQEGLEQKGVEVY